MNEAKLEDCLVADKILTRLDADIRDRKGLKHEWSAIDQDVMNYELRPAWIKIIMEEIVKAGDQQPEAVQNVGTIAGSFQRKVSVLFALAGTEAHANRVEHQLADAVNEAAMQVLTDYAHERGEEVAWEVRGSKHANRAYD